MPWQSQNHIIIRNHTILVKAINVTVIITLIFNINLSYAFSNRTLFDTKSHAQRSVRTEAEESLLDIEDNPAAISIPPAYGLIVESYKGKGSSLVVHIQDCHVNEIAQFNIARILKTLLKNYDIRLLCLEGASKRLDTSFYDTFPDGETKEKVSRFFVKKALFTGAEYFKITNRDQGISAFGVEDKDLYLAHLEVYQDVQPDKSKIISYLTGLETALNRIKERIYPKPLKELEAKDREYQDKIITLAEYASYINRSAKRLKADLRHYPNFRNFIRLVKKEKSINFKKAEEQREELIEELSQRLEEKQLKRLLKLSLDYRLNKISAIAFYDYLQGLLPITDYQELLSYIEYLRISSAINHLKLFEEIESLNEKITSSLFKSQADKTVFRYSKSLAASKDLYNLRLTHKALDYMDNNPAEFDIERIAIFIKNTSAALGIPANFDYLPDYLSARELESARQFYQIATERDIAIVNNTLRRLPSSSNKTAVLVTGGFHTSGITNILRQKQISYVVICPIIGMENYQRLYAYRMKGIIPDYADILQLVSQMLVPALATGGIIDNLKIKTAFSIAFAGILQSEGLKRILDSDEPGLTLPKIRDDKPLRLEDAARIIKAAINAERAETGKLAFVEVDKTQGATIAVSEKLPVAAIKMSSVGQVDAEAIRREVDKRFSYEYKPQKVIMPDEKTTKRYHFTRDKAEIIRMFEERNWYYRDYNEQERKAFIERIWDGLQDGLTEHIRETIASAVGIKQENIVSILLYGSWAYAKGTPTDMDIAVIVKGEHIREIIPDCNIEHPEQFFTKKGRHVDHFDLNIISEDYLRETTDTSAIDFLTSMWGHGILLEGMDYLRSPPADHNTLIKARLLVMLALLYCEDKVRENDWSKIDPKEKLRKIERRISEAKRIFKLLFSESHLGVGDEEMGRKPTLEAIDEAVEIINKANGAIEDDRGVSEAVFTDSLFPLLSRVWEQTQTVFVEERLIAQEVKRRLVEIRGLQQKTPQAIQGLTLSGTDRMEPPASTIKPSSAGYVGTKEKPPFSVKKMVGTAVVTAAIGGLTHFGVVVVDKDLASDTKHGMVIVKDDPSDTRTPKSSSKVSRKPMPTRPLKESKIAANVIPRKIGKSSRTFKEASTINFRSQQIPQPPTVAQRARIKVASARPGRPLAVSGAITSTPQETLIVSRIVPASTFYPGQGFTLHPAVFIGEEDFSSEEQVKKEQVKNYKAAYERVPRIVELVFGDKISEEQKRCWRLLLLGTEVTESNFLDRYSKVMPSGNGRYQVTGSTAYGIIHSYVTYPIRIKTKSGKVIYRTGMRKELIPLFAKATDNKVTWDAVKNMSKSQLRKRLAADDNFSCLMSLLVYKEVLEREGIKAINSDPKVLAMLWKQYYNTIHGKGTVEGFMKRFALIHKIPSEALEILCRKTEAEYKKLFFHKGLGANCSEEEARKRYSQFKEENDLDKDFSNRVVTLLRDEYGITPSNIYSKITPFKAMLDNKVRYAKFKDDELVHIIIYRKHGKLNVRLVVCRDISQWAREKEKAMADIILHHENELYNVLTNPFQKKTEVQATERIWQDTGFTPERIPTLSIQKTIEAATVRPGISPRIVKLHANRLAVGAEPSSAGESGLTGEGRPGGIDTLLKDKRRYKKILQQA